MSIAVVHPNEWPKVDEAFRQDNKNLSLKDFILVMAFFVYYFVTKSIPVFRVWEHDYLTLEIGQFQQKFTSNKIMAEMMAVIVDPKFKPTVFSETPPASPP